MSRRPWWLADAAARLAAARERRGEAIGHPGALARSQDPPRDYIAEAGRIARGESRMIPELEHVRALVDQAGGILRSLVEEWDAAGTVTKIHSATNEDTIELARALLDRLEDLDAPTPAAVAYMVEQRHAEIYPGGCPLMCEACTARLRGGRS